MPSELASLVRQVWDDNKTWLRWVPKFYAVFLIGVMTGRTLGAW